MKRNINAHIGFILIAIIFINTISYLFTYESLSSFEKGIYSFTSLTIPILFMLWGYKFSQVSDKLQEMKIKFKEYLVYGLVTLVGSLVLFNINYTIYDLLLFNQSSVGFMWLLKIQLYCFAVIYSVKNDKEYLITLLLVFLVSTRNTNDLEIIIYLVSFILGYLLGKNKWHISSLIPKYMVVLVTLTPIVFQNYYVTADIRQVMFAFLVVNWIVKSKSYFKFKFFQQLNQDFVKYLVVHYFIIETLSQIEIYELNLIQLYFIVLISSWIIVNGYNYVEYKFKEELSRI